MGLLVNGEWVDEDSVPTSSDGSFIRVSSGIKNKISKEPNSKYLPTAGRYHLYAIPSCPWAHRTLITRKLKNLDNIISFSFLDPNRNNKGWEFPNDSDPEVSYGFKYLYELYAKSDPTYTGRVSVPVLWDKETQTIVSNDSSEIIVMLNNEFEGIDYYPENLRTEIDQINEFVYDKVNNGVYKAGFAKKQEAYDQAVTELFDALNVLEQRLNNQRFLVRNLLTLADVRLVTTLIRFDIVYVVYFKCNLRRLVDYPNLWNYTKDVFQIPGISETADINKIKNYYFQSSGNINPTRIVPKGPLIDFFAPHDRNRFS